MTTKLSQHTDSDELTHAETTADADTIRETIARLERNGTIYNASGDADAPEWKVTDA